MSAIRKAARVAADSVDIYLSWLTAALRRAAPQAHGRLLDVGCGDRRFEPFFAAYVKSYTGVEHEAVFATTDASRRATAPDVLYDGKRLPFDGASFDTVISTEVLEHTPDPASLVREMARVLAPGGTMILTAPFSFRLHEEPYDYFRYTPHGLTSLLQGAGMRVTEIIPFGGVFSVVGHKLNSYLAFRVAHLQGLGRALGKMSHEGSEHGERLRPWTLPVVVPAMLGLAVGARFLDRVAHDPTESLGYLVIARRASDA